MPTPDDGSLFFLSDSTQPISVIPRRESKQHNSNHEPKEPTSGLQPDLKELGPFSGTPTIKGKLKRHFSKLKAKYLRFSRKLNLKYFTFILLKCLFNFQFNFLTFLNTLHFQFYLLKSLFQLSIKFSIFTRKIHDLIPERKDKGLRPKFCLG